MGLVVPIGAENTPYESAAKFGFYAAGNTRADGIRWAVGLDAFSLKGRGRDMEADVLGFRLDFSFARDAALQPVQPYMQTGVRFYMDQTKTYWGDRIEVAAAVALGGGLRGRGTPWDAWVTVEALAGSRNLWGFVTACAGVSF